MPLVIQKVAKHNLFIGNTVHFSLKDYPLFIHYNLDGLFILLLRQQTSTETRFEAEPDWHLQGNGVLQSQVG